MYESPTYTETLVEGHFSIREYTTFKTVKADQAKMNGYGTFDALFGYISGQNQNRTSMKMTVPVINDLQDEGMTMEFVIPKLHSDHTPSPSMSALEIKTYPSTLVAVARFSGSTSFDKIEQERLALLQWVESKGYKTQGTVKIARYNAPFTPGFLRRNEIWISIEKVSL
jgi:effector-binding domain-containing protein